MSKKEEDPGPVCKLAFLSWNWPFILMWSIYVAILAAVAVMASCSLSPEQAQRQAQTAGEAAALLTGSPVVGKAVEGTWNALLWGLGVVAASSGAVAARQAYKRRKRKDSQRNALQPKR